MAQFDNNIQPNRIQALTDLLRYAADNPDVHAIAPRVLRDGLTLTHTQAALFALFEEPYIQITHQLDEHGLSEDNHELADAVQDLSYDIHVSSHLPYALASRFDGWLLIPLLVDDRAVGLVAFLFTGNIELDEETTNILMSMVDALRAVTHTTIMEARHVMQSRNQYEFVRLVSHDLRSPLAAMKGFASMLESKMIGDLNEKQAHFIERILSGIEQMSAQVDNIQDAGRYDPDTGFYEMERKPADLIDMVHDIVDKHIIPAEKNDLILRVKADEHVPIVKVDITMFERAITNLVDNAIKYSPDEGGEIEVGVRVENNYAIVTVTDNGYGISEENLKKLFQRHFRVRRREHNRVKGSGLGLFIVRSVARYHDGDAFVESVEGEGSTFGIRIPLSEKNLFLPGQSAE